MVRAAAVPAAVDVADRRADSPVGVVSSARHRRLRVALALVDRADAVGVVDAVVRRADRASR